MDELVIPQFLKDAPKRPLTRARKWKKVVALRPEGEKWENAERWEVTVPGDPKSAFNGLGSGTRYVWVVQGRKWAFIRDAEGHAKVPISEWAAVARKGRVVS